ncbi:casein kinase, putative [Entamoeba invadens IP1]|uniref:Casein kinase, putative n=1 Tax=Entamoeba invadens IP1 TaxID=370355 RepID=A0A0A1UBE1_ENTIV|nr:casein kinase, putative [Entamoeba invadens IP1]ELP92519.1 casein kinase, putative [Entamoeba invadens IP1]|eukprot:XP_004259290.1 casein kinase, putative [Entamoeba invadens IP1]
MNRKTAPLKYFSNHFQRLLKTLRVQQEPNASIDLNDELCEGLPEEFATYLDTCKKLSFDQTPDYLQLRMLFWKIAKREIIVFDGKFDWTGFKGQKSEDRPPEVVTAVEKNDSVDSRSGSGSKAGSKSRSQSPSGSVE